MLGRITQISHEQYAALLSHAWTRRITSVHIHHTWRPRAGQWKGMATVEAMRRVHMQDNGWSDIAQHLTVGPDGTLWTGRHLDQVPASAKGFNGSGAEGPLMIEMVGDFDVGQELFGGAQEQAAHRAAAAACQAFGLPAAAVRFHREFNPDKSCPGTSIDLDVFRRDVAALLTGNAGAPPAPRQLVAPFAGSAAVDADGGAEPVYAVSGSRAAQFDAAPRAWRVSDAERRVFAAHVVNTEMGRLSGSGTVTGSPEALDDLITSLDRWALAQTRPHVVVFAHGGLVSESRALRDVVLKQYAWWLANGVYPIFFVWETGLGEVFSQTGSDAGTRGFKDDLLEKILGPTVGRPAWSRMKASAFLASQPDAGDGQPGGARLLAERLTAWLTARGRDAAPVSIHAVGHSAGAIYLSHFLPVLSTLLRDGKLRIKARPVIDTLALLAPACRADLFKERLLPLITRLDIGRFAEFTMTEEAERNDSLAGVYGLSLLYAVRNACERDRPQILGLEESIRPDPDLRALFGLNPGQKGRADLVSSPTPGVSDGPGASLATSHGAFDEDPATMNSVLRRILDLPAQQSLPLPMLPQASQPQPDGPEGGFRELHRAGGRALALCIGIDAYADSPLSGCVADTQLWARTLQSRGVTVLQVLTDAQATKSAIVKAWQDICAQAQDGDTVIIQFAGHGTQVPDLSGDERADGLDEAWVAYDYLKGAVLTDDEIGALIDRCTPAGVQVVLFTDMCHSGSATRARELPAHGRQGIRMLPLHRHTQFLRAFEAAAPGWARKLGGRADGEPQSEIHFAACQDDQYAYEQDGHGAFTLAAVASLDADPAPQTYLELSLAVSSRFSGNARQRPGFRAPPARAQHRLFTSPEGAPAALSARAEPESQILERLDRLDALVRDLTRKFDTL